MRRRFKEAARSVAGVEEMQRLEDAVRGVERSSEAAAAAILDRLDRIIELLENIRPGR